MYSKHVNDQRNHQARARVPEFRCWAKWVFAVCLYGLCFLPMLAFATAAKPVLMDSSRLSLFKDAQFLGDHNNLTIDTILAPRGDAGFAPLALGTFLYGEDPVWVRVVLQSVTEMPREWWLEATPASIDRLTLYQVKADGTVFAKEAGKVVPFSGRDIDYRNPVFRLQFDARETQVLYLKIESKFNGLRKLLLWEPGQFQISAIQAQLAWGFFLGVASLLVIASLWFERALKDGIYRAFACYVFSCMLLMLVNTGLLYQYFIPGFDVLLRLPLAMWFSMLANVVGIGFFMKFTGIVALKPTVSRWYWHFVWTSGVLVAIGLVTSYAFETRQVMLVLVGFIYMPCTILLLWKPVLQGASEVRFAFFVSGLLLSLTVIVNAFVVSGWLPPDERYEHITPVTMLVFFLVIYYAISKRYKRMREEKDIAQLNMLDMVRDSERALEIQVAEKTRDLRLAMEDVGKALEQERVVYEEQKNFVAMVSHELRTPLAFIDAATHNMMREAPKDMQPIHNNLTVIQQATDRLSLLVSDQLDQPATHVLSSVAHIGIIALQPLFDEVIDGASLLAPHHRFVIASDIPETIDGDSAMLQLILRAVIDEVVRTTPFGTIITLRAMQLSQQWLIEISDNGDMVVDASNKDKPTREYKLSELELSLVKQLLTLLGGELKQVGLNAQHRTCIIALPRKPHGEGGGHD
jgi:signal transduction histidine kinase